MTDNRQELILELAATIAEEHALSLRPDCDGPGSHYLVLCTANLLDLDLSPKQFESARRQVIPYHFAAPYHDLANRLIEVVEQVAMETAQDLRAQFEQYVVEAASVADFLSRYYKAERYTGRNKATGWDDDYAADLLADYEADFARDGWIFIGEHDSATGRIVSLMRLTLATERI